MTKKSRPAVLVTGGARRLGRAVALAFAEDGFDVAIHYNRSVSEAVKTVAAIRKLGVDSDIFQADLLDEGDVVGLVHGVIRRFPNLEGLINSASIFVRSGIGSEDLELLEKNLAVHVKAPWGLTAEFAKGVTKGFVVNFLDTRIAKDKTDFGAYLLSKKALFELTKMQAVRFAPQIRVNAVAPGLVLPPEGLGMLYLRKRAKGVPLQRHGSVEDVLQAVRFLTRSGYVTGQTIFVDGGEHLAF